MNSLRGGGGNTSLLAELQGFTLAEVLITLGIIGVVAAMTLPALVQNSRNKELQSGLKKAYSTISQALDLYQAENGERYIVQNHEPGKLKPSIIKYFKISKDCGQGSEATEEELKTTCVPNYSKFGETYQSANNIYKNFNGTSNMHLKDFDDGQFVLMDGMLILLEDSSDRNLYISVDVNGFNKKPNRLGQDLFMFQIDDKGFLRPMGAEGTTYYSETEEYCSTTSTYGKNGAGCTYKALHDDKFFNNLK